jgi:hypothetical protein
MAAATITAITIIIILLKSNFIFYLLQVESVGLQVLFVPVVGLLDCVSAGFAAGAGVGAGAGAGAGLGVGASCGFTLCCITGLVAGDLGGCGCGWVGAVGLVELNS